MIEKFIELDFYQTGMLISNASSASLTFILLVLNIWWHVSKK